MPSVTVNFPTVMDLPSIFKFAKDLDSYAMNERIVLNFDKDVFFAPFSMLFLAAKIKYFQKCNPQVKVIFNGWEDQGYLSHMGFFTMCGKNFGKRLGEALGSINYLPITELTRDSFVERASDKYEELPDLIQRRVDTISEVIARSNESEMFKVLSYSIREIFRNVFEHGETDRLYYCAQYWPQSQKVEFSVVDFGIGIRRGLGTNPNFRFADDKKAIEYSLLPSVSGKTHLARVSETWYNSGYGLYMTSRLARNGGNFVIASGLNAVHLTPKSKNNYNTAFHGTAIRLNLNVNAIGVVQARLAEFRKDGAEIAASISGSGNRPPSAMSLLLRRDYK